MQRTTAETTEIERHKYYLSEQQGHDVGWEFAEQDWEANYASAWRQEHSPVNRSPVNRSPENLDSVVTMGGPAESIQLDPALPLERGTGPLLRLFSKLFAKS